VDLKVDERDLSKRTTEASMKKLIAGVILLAAVVAAMPAEAQNTCDHPCLLKTAHDYLAAVVANDAKKAAMASSAKFTEQAKVRSIHTPGPQSTQERGGCGQAVLRDVS